MDAKRTSPRCRQNCCRSGRCWHVYDHQFGNVEGKKLNVGIPYVETSVYADPHVGDDVESELYSMWIRGEWER